METLNNHYQALMIMLECKQQFTSFSFIGHPPFHSCIHSVKFSSEMINPKYTHQYLLHWFLPFLISIPDKINNTQYILQYIEYPWVPQILQNPSWLKVSDNNSYLINVNIPIYKE